MKKILGVYNALDQHWVGNGFPVRSLFSYDRYGKELSPFLLLDYAEPVEFSPTDQPRGVGQHPHRGFETVTIAYQGEVAHQDSAGNSGIIRSGDVQWMTAGSGVLHEEFHSEAFTRSGGQLEMAQLWVNLPAKYKMTAPDYQAILNSDIPAVVLPNEVGIVRVIAGNYDGHTGPAHTFTPMQVWDLRLNQGGTCELSAQDGWSSALVVLRGTVTINGSSAKDAQVVVLNQAGSALTITANNDAVLLFLSGEPINEPIIGQGPFVMNSQEEINQAITDFNSGRFGQIT